MAKTFAGMVCYIRRDDDGNFYLVPENKITEFEALENAMQETSPPDEVWYDACDRFERQFAQYRMEGDLYTTRLAVLAKREEF